MSNQSADIDHLLKLETGELSITGTLRIQAMTAPGLITSDSINAYLLGRDIHSQAVIQGEIDKLVEAVRNDNTVPHEAVIAKGTPPIHGTNARIDLTEDIAERFERIQKRKEAFLIAQEDNTFDPDAGNAIDFYNESSFVTALESDHIGNFVEHTEGTDGTDIFGRMIAAKPGKPISKPCDESCRIDAKGRIIAMQDGLIHVQHDRICVQSTLNIPGYVDFSTGNIDFPGDIVIEKGVRDRFRVDSDFNIEIHKLVEAAHLHSDSNIKLHQGMAGRETGTINAVGDLDSGYLDAVDAHITGNCIIEREVTNCNLHISGRVEARNATIRGGIIEVARGGVVGTLGSEGGVRTDVVLASHPVIQKQISQIKALLPRISSEIEKSKREFQAIKASSGRANPELETEICFLESNLQSLNAKKSDLESALDRLYTLLGKHTHCELTVAGRIFAKTQLWLPGKHVSFDHDLKGEFTIRLNAGGQPVFERDGKSEPLSTHAKVNSDDRVPAPLKEASKAA